VNYLKQDKILKGRFILNLRSMNLFMLDIINWGEWSMACWCTHNLFFKRWTTSECKLINYSSL